MDSGNSGSMQSSSDEEYDSRPESAGAAAFLNPSSNFGSLSNPNPSFLSHHQNQQPPTTFFDPSSNYLHAFSQSQPNSNSSSLLNLELVGPGSLRSDPNYTDKATQQGSSSSTQPMMLAAQGLNHAPFASSSSMQPRLVHDNGARYSNQTNAVKNPKKRTRASRRAPTTVLTTDTSNFRAMVQEFTGIPAPPFSGSPYSRRLDLFGSGSAIKAGQMEPIGPLYPLRPTTHKFQPIPFITSSSSMVDANISASTSNLAAAATTNNNNTITITTSRNLAPTFSSPSTSSNYHLVSDLGLTKEPQNMLNMQPNPVLSFLQPPLNPPQLNVPGFGAKSQASFGMPSLEELAMGGGHGHGHVNTNLGGLASGQDQMMRPFDGNYNHSSQRVTGTCKLNYTASSSDFHHDKSLENVSSRAEGTVDSWICPSD